MATARHFSIKELYEDHRKKLKLDWVVAADSDRQVQVNEKDVFGPDVVGHFNVIYHHRIQVMGSPEKRWAEQVGIENWNRQIKQLFTYNPPAIIVANGIEVPPEIRKISEKSQTPLFTTPKPCSEVIDILHLYLAYRFADTKEFHGTLMDVFGIGVFITGDSGIGKSELALELLSRGHGLVADDLVEMARIAPNTIEGRFPDKIARDLLEVRGLGVINVRTIYGETAARRKMKLRLVVHLQRTPPDEGSSRLVTEMQTEDILGAQVPKVVFYVAPGRNLAVLLEAAVRNFILRARGIDSTSEFVAHHEKALRSDAEGE